MGKLLKSITIISNHNHVGPKGRGAEKNNELPSKCHKTYIYEAEQGNPISLYVFKRSWFRKRRKESVSMVLIFRIVLGKVIVMEEA